MGCKKNNNSDNKNILIIHKANNPTQSAPPVHQGNFTKDAQQLKQKKTRLV